jgi:succinate dehydrogenase / fumarate reductase flavoprotein subunit
VSERFETHEHDVIVIGAGGAGLRAAIEASASGVSVALVCKSLLGKAHTVMAEGGVAAALAHVDPQDNWQTHFMDTMKGGSFLNHWRMAQLHAQEAPDRVRELEQWGALFDRTPDGRILQRAFGGHTWKRLAHVGDRTGLEMIRTLQDRGVHSGLDVYMECTVTRLLKDGDRIAGALAYWRESGRFVVFRAKAVVIATGGIGKSYRVTSNSWEYTGDGQALAYDAGADLIDMEFVQFHPTGMVWPPGVMGLLVTEGVRGEGGILRNSKGERFMWKYLPEARRHEYAENDAEARQWVEDAVAGRQGKSRRPAGAVDARQRRARDLHRGEGGPRLAARRRVPRHQLPAAERVKRKLPSMYHQFMELADVDITKGPMEVGPTTHYMMGGLRVDPTPARRPCPGCSPRARPRPACTAPTRSAATRSPTCSCSAGAPARVRPRVRQGLARRRSVNEPRSRPRPARCSRRSSALGREPYEVHRALQDVNGPLSASSARPTSSRAIESWQKLEHAPPPCAWRARACSTPAGTCARTSATWSRSPRPSRARRCCEGSRGAPLALDFTGLDRRWQVNHAVTKAPDGMRVTATPLPAMPAELKQLFDAGAPPKQEVAR